MLRVGLTGGIGSGKSTVARLLVQRGAVLVDSDVLAREVVAPGTQGLAQIVETFGADVLDASGALNRPALAAVVFQDREARERLNGIVHPLVRFRSDELIAAAAPDAIVVQDIPLLVEGGMGAHFPLVVVVHTPATERIERLVRHRGMPEADARARVEAQVDDDARRAAADIWLDNGGAPGAMDPVVAELWGARLVPFEENLRRHRAVRFDRLATVAPNPQWVADGARLVARVAAAVGDRGHSVDHVGDTAVPGLPARDVIDLQVGLSDPADPAVRAALQHAGFPPLPVDDLPADNLPADKLRGDLPDDESASRRHGTADPGRAAVVHLRRVDSPEWRCALMVRDWLRTDMSARENHAASALRETPVPSAATLDRAEAWAESSGWVPAFR